MKAHKKLLETLTIASRIARLNAPHAASQRVRLDLSVAEVDELEAEAMKLFLKMEDLEQQLSAVHYLCGDLEVSYRD